MEVVKSTTTAQQNRAGRGPDVVPGQVDAADAKAMAPAQLRDAVPAAPDAVASPGPVDEEALKQRRSAQENAQRIRELAESLNRELEFRVAQNGRTIIDVVDKETGEVIRTIPPEDQQRVIDALTQGDVSLLLDGAA